MITGIVIAPHSEVQLYNGVQCDGALYAKKVLIEAVAGVESGGTDPDRDPDNDFVPSFSEYKLHTDPYDPLDYTAIGIPSNAMIDNTAEQTVFYDYSVFFSGYARATGVEISYPANSLTDPSSPILFQIRNLPATAPEYNESDFMPEGRYLEPLYNSLASGATVSIGVPLPDNIMPGAQYKVAIYRGGTWEELEVKTGEQAVYAENSGNLGPMILVRKPADAVYYFDNSVYSYRQVSKIDIDLVISGSTNTADPAGTFTLNYTDYSGGGSGTSETISLDFGRPDGTLVTRGTYTIYGRIVVTSANITIAAPDNVNYTFTGTFDIDRGQSIYITSAQSITALNGGTNIPDKLVFAYGTDNLAYEYTGLDGEGQIRKGSGGSYHYNFHLKDHLGSTRMVITDDGDITEAVMYQPYGTMESLSDFSSSAAPAREKFTGKEFDEDGAGNGAAGIGLFYFGARLYDANLGVWLAADKLRQFWSPYAYAGNGINPINATDPDGLELLSIMARITCTTSRWSGGPLLQQPEVYKTTMILTRYTPFIRDAIIGINPSTPSFDDINASPGKWTGWTIERAFKLTLYLIDIETVYNDLLRVDRALSQIVNNSWYTYFNGPLNPWELLFQGIASLTNLLSRPGIVTPLHNEATIKGN